MKTAHTLSQCDITQPCRVALLKVLGQLDSEEADRCRSASLSLLIEVVRSYRPVPPSVRRVCDEVAAAGSSANGLQDGLKAFNSWLLSLKLPAIVNSLPPSQVVSVCQPSDVDVVPVAGQQQPLVRSNAEEEIRPQQNAGAVEPKAAWIGPLMSSEVFEQQKQVGGRGLPSDDVFARLLNALDRRGGKMTSVALALAIDFPTLRLPGLLAKVQRILNIDGYSVLSHDDTSDTVELNRDLLLKQFHLT